MIKVNLEYWAMRVSMSGNSCTVDLPFVCAFISLCFVRRLQTECDNSIHASTNGKMTECADREWRSRGKAIHRRLRCDKTALYTTTELFQPRGGVHDVAIEDDRAFDVADFADDHRPKCRLPRMRGAVPNSRSNCPALRASSSRMAMKQRNGRQSTAPSRFVQVTIISSPT